MLAALVLGFRHGFDPDHVAALTDIAGSQMTRLRALLYSTLYIVGHALTVLLLGVAIDSAGIRIPNAQRVIGATLIAMGLYVLWQTARGQNPRSRAHLLHAVLHGLLQATRRRLRRRIDVEHEHEHEHRDSTDVPQRSHGHTHAEPPMRLHLEGSNDIRIRHRHVHRHVRLSIPYGTVAAMSVGMVHGLGAETPTQVLALSSGLWALPPFIFGLLLGNTVVAAISIGLLTQRRLRIVNILVAIFSIVVGVPYLIGLSSPLAW